MLTIGRIGWTLVSGLLALGCAQSFELRPALPEQRFPGRAAAAYADTNGVRLIVDGAPWHERPYDLGRIVIPVLVTIENHSGVSLRIRYEQFALVTQSGVQARALSPWSIQRPGPHRSVNPPRSPEVGFSGEPQFAPYYYPGLSSWSGSLGLDGASSRTEYRLPSPLPTQEMVERAMHEGELQNHDQVTGYLYFEPFRGDVHEANFTAELIGANQEHLGEVSVPFIVERG